MGSAIQSHTFRRFERRKMQNQGECVTEMALQQSAGSMLARAFSRSKGLPVPFMPATPVQNNNGSGQGWTMLHDYPFGAHDNGVINTCILPAISIAGCIIVCRRLLE